MTKNVIRMIRRRPSWIWPFCSKRSRVTRCHPADSHDIISIQKNFILQNHVQPRYGVWLLDYIEVLPERVCCRSAKLVSLSSAVFYSAKFAQLGDETNELSSGNLPNYQQHYHLATTRSEDSQTVIRELALDIRHYCYWFLSEPN